MHRLGLAVRLFFRILADAELAGRIEQVLAGGHPPAAQTAAETSLAAAKSSRSDAVTLLAVLQREARFVDFVKEPIDGYSDAQIGAAVREVHRQCDRVLDRCFELRPTHAADEGAEIELTRGFDAGRYRLTGRVTDELPFRGRLVHHGWEAGTTNLPLWTGNPDAALVVAPAEVELR